MHFLDSAFTTFASLPLNATIYRLPQTETSITNKNDWQINCRPLLVPQLEVYACSPHAWVIKNVIVTWQISMCITRFGTTHGCITAPTDLSNAPLLLLSSLFDCKLHTHVRRGATMLQFSWRMVLVVSAQQVEQQLMDDIWHFGAGLEMLCSTLRRS